MLPVLSVPQTGCIDLSYFAHFSFFPVGCQSHCAFVQVGGKNYLLAIFKRFTHSQGTSELGAESHRQGGEVRKYL